MILLLVKLGSGYDHFPNNSPIMLLVPLDQAGSPGQPLGGAQESGEDRLTHASATCSRRSPRCTHVAPQTRSFSGQQAVVRASTSNVPLLSKAATRRVQPAPGTSGPERNFQEGPSLSDLAPQSLPEPWRPAPSSVVWRLQCPPHALGNATPGLRTEQPGSIVPSTTTETSACFFVPLSGAWHGHPGAGVDSDWNPEPRQSLELHTFPQPLELKEILCHQGLPRKSRGSQNLCHA